jgi:hypothetical protein
MIDASSPKPGYPGVLPPPPGVTPDIDFKQSSLNLLTQLACIAITTIFLILRFYTKHIRSLGYHADDCKLKCTDDTSNGGRIRTDCSRRGFPQCLGMLSNQTSHLVHLPVNDYAGFLHALLRALSGCRPFRPRNSHVECYPPEVREIL